MEHRAGLKWNLIQLMSVEVHKDTVFLGMVKLVSHLKNLEEQAQDLLVMHAGN